MSRRGSSRSALHCGGRLVEGLADASPTDAAATLLLGRYDVEPDPAVKLLAAIAYAGQLVATNTVTDEVINAFTEQARAAGHDYHERRAAAFGALARLGCLDKLTDLREQFGDHRPVRIHHSYLSDAALFFRLICRYWDGNWSGRRVGVSESRVARVGRW